MINFLKDFRTLWGAIVLLIPMAIWAADTVFQTDKEAILNSIEMLEYQKQDLETSKGYAESAREKEKIEALIRNKESQINQLKGRIK